MMYGMSDDLIDYRDENIKLKERIAGLEAELIDLYDKSSMQLKKLIKMQEERR